MGARTLSPSAIYKRSDSKFWKNPQTEKRGYTAYMTVRDFHFASAATLRDVMDIRQAAEYLGISSDTLYKYAAEGIIPAFKLGNRWRFRRVRLEEWMKNKEERNGAGSV